FILLQHFGCKLPIHGSGHNKRHYLAADDFARAVMLLVREGEFGEVYNVGSHEERTNLEMARMICDAFGHDVGEWVQFVEDRPFNDARYSIEASRIEALGWVPHRRLVDELPHIVAWYRENEERFRAVMGFGKTSM
ncbi:MAG: GDP-mannose 4,6-dehydratase, partial [Pseudorhodoplanes sp.]|nr:GDP-mannose 4,6-dehydratase [Pseudorhodoplanes sp.]